MGKVDNFILTQDIDTAKKLIDMGFTLVQNNSGVWTFLNCKSLTFSDKEKKNFIYSNKITF